MKTTIEKIQDKLISADGTALAFERAGSGSALILVHGTGADHTRWSSILPRLADSFKIFSLDRRGGVPPVMHRITASSANMKTSPPSPHLCKSRSISSGIPLVPPACWALHQ